MSSPPVRSMYGERPDYRVDLLARTPGLRLVLLNALRGPRGAPVRPLLAAGGAWADIAMLEGAGGLERLIAEVGPDRLLFGSHAPLFYAEAAHLKLRESALTPAQVEAIRDQLADVLTGIHPQSTPVAFFSTVTGEAMETAGLTADYWYRSIRQTVQFEPAVRRACAAGYRVFVESSPHPILTAGIEEVWADCQAGDATVIPSLGRDDGGLHRFWLSAGQAFAAGVNVDWRAALADCANRTLLRPPRAHGACEARTRARAGSSADPRPRTPRFRPCNIRSRTRWRMHRANAVPRCAPRGPE